MTSFQISSTPSKMLGSSDSRRFLEVILRSILIRLCSDDSSQLSTTMVKSFIAFQISVGEK